MVSASSRALNHTLRAALVVVLCVTASRAFGDESAIPCRYLYETTDGVYVEIGSGTKLVEGGEGWLEFEGNRVATVRIGLTSKSSVFLEIVEDRRQNKLAAGDDLILHADALAVAEEGERERSKTLKGDRDDSFVPLMGRLQLYSTGTSEKRNLFQGSLTLRQAYQMASDEHDFYATRARSSGSLEYVEGTPWTLEWSGDVAFRDGSGYDGSRYEGLRFELYRLSFHRRIDERWLRFGRFVPRELPGVGFIDGIQAEQVTGDATRFGSVVGFRPGRNDLDFRADELVVVPYLTYESGDPGAKYYSMTAGLLGSLYRWSPDRLALLVDQRLDRDEFTAYASSEVDVDVGAAEADRGPVRLTRLNVLLTRDFGPALTLRGGVDKHELPDTEGERDALDIGNLDENEWIDSGFWRYWIGASHQLPGSLRLSEEIAFLDSSADNVWRGNVSLTRVGLPGLPAGSLTLSAFNLHGMRHEGFGGRVSFYLPFAEHRFIVEPAVGYRYTEFTTRGANFFGRVRAEQHVVDASLRFHWRLSRAWLLAAGVAYSDTSEASRIFADVALTFRW